ncbi:MAG: class I SAM-dependent methyltransferase [Candidatus Marinarcus sp.]|uniref:class I SAM-dependent methyltransferase n=1 Tax=Candidatus Marinarcus sp. TaxID=3100987 RepID=UPI003B009842
MNYHDIDFNALYMEQKCNSTFKIKDKQEWNKKAASMNKKIHKSIYNDDLIAKMDFSGCESLLDVGCGVGNVAMKLAKKVSTVYALDYSDVMLEFLDENIKAEQIHNIIPIKASWDDCDWSAIPEADIVLASRSMEVKDMKDALEKINAKAKKRVYLSYKVGGSFVDKKILKVLDKAIFDKPDYIYVLNILYGMGINPKVDYLKSEGRREQYDTKENFIKSVEWSLDTLTQKEKETLAEYYDCLGENKEGLGEQYNHWALISWEVKA